jgi:hypothetical protein
MSYSDYFYDYDGYSLTIGCADKSMVLFGDEAADLYDELEEAVKDKTVAAIIDPYL